LRWGNNVKLLPFFYILTTKDMAVIVAKAKNDKSKPKKEFIDLSLEHKHYKQSQKIYKILFFSSLIVNISLLLYINLI